MGFPWNQLFICLVMLNWRGGAGQGFLAFFIGEKVRSWNPYFVGKGRFCQSLTDKRLLNAHKMKDHLVRMFCRVSREVGFNKL